MLITLMSSRVLSNCRLVYLWKDTAAGEDQLFYVKWITHF